MVSISRLVLLFGSLRLMLSLKGYFLGSICSSSESFARYRRLLATLMLFVVLCYVLS